MSRSAVTGCSDRSDGAPAVGVRPLRVEELPEVQRIDLAHSGKDKMIFWERVRDEFFGYRRNRFRVALAAEVDGVLAGFALGELRAFEFGSDACGWVFAVGVEPAYARCGVGSALLRDACRRFREAGVRQVRTMVRREDVPVLSFFRANGFVGGCFTQLQLDLTQAVSETLE
jgi:ribosomal protein S18 acetylase RimI-like enzyme